MNPEDATDQNASQEELSPSSRILGRMVRDLFRAAQPATVLPCVSVPNDRLADVPLAMRNRADLREYTAIIHADEYGAILGIEVDEEWVECVEDLHPLISYRVEDDIAEENEIADANAANEDQENRRLNADIAARLKGFGG